MSMIGNYRRLKQAELDELLAQPDDLAAFLYGQAAPENYLDVDKTWHVIHYLLNGKTWEGNYPFSETVLGGRELSDEDLGYGPARYVLPHAVRETSAALDSVSAEELLSRYDPERVAAAEIYPDGWNASDEDIDYIAANYRALVEFFRAAAANGDAVIVWIS